MGSEGSVLQEHLSPAQARAFPSTPRACSTESQDCVRQPFFDRRRGFCRESFGAHIVSPAASPVVAQRDAHPVFAEHSFSLQTFPSHTRLLAMFDQKASSRYAHQRFTLAVWPLLRYAHDRFVLEF